MRTAASWQAKWTYLYWRTVSSVVRNNRSRALRSARNTWTISNLTEGVVNPFKEVNWKPDARELRKFAWSLIVGFPCVAALLLAVGCLRGKGWNLSLALEVGCIGAVAGIIFLVMPTLAKPLYLIWYAAACTVGITLGNVLLLAVFYLFITGIGLLKRALGSQP